MKLSEVCIDRPVLATVLSLVIVLFGGIALSQLQNRELPDVDEPIVSVTTVYPGAAPEVVETSVTQPLEDQLIGIEGVRHLTSQSREQASTITVEFELDRDIEAAANDVRDRVARSRRELPDEVEDPIVAKRDSDAQAVMWLAVSGDNYTQIQISRLVETRLKDRFSKLTGVSDVLVAGERRYAMRIWLHGDRLVAHGLTIQDVADALRRENVDIPSGRVEGVDREYTVRSLGELRTVAGYESLIVASVNGTGLVTALLAGTTWVVVTNGTAKDSTAVTVTSNVTTPTIRVGKYVAPDGSSSNDGSYGKPWDLATALAGAGGRVGAGDTIWVRGGTYRGPFTSTVAGKAVARSTAPA